MTLSGIFDEEYINLLLLHRVLSRFFANEDSRGLGRSFIQQV